MNAVIINTSGQRLPNNTVEYIQAFSNKQYESIVEYRCRSQYILTDEDIWKQVEERLEELFEGKIEEKRLMEWGTADYYLFVTALSTPAIMLANAFKCISGINPYLVVVTKVQMIPAITQIVDLRAWEGRCRTELKERFMSSLIYSESRSSKIKIKSVA